VIRRATLAIAACAGLLAAGCGGGGDGGSPSFTGPDPASLTPADAPLFAEAVVRPEGDQKTALDGALSKLLATDDPGGFIVERLDKALAKSQSGLNYEEDIAPWLGQRAGVFFKSFTNHAEAAFVVPTTNPGASQQAIDAAAAADKAPERKFTYKGFHYLLAHDDTAAGVVGNFAILGSEQGFRDAVDASQGDSLAGSSDFQTQLDQAPDDEVAFAYADPKGIVTALEKAHQLTPSQVQAAGPQLQGVLSQPATASVSATADQIALEASAGQSSTAPAPRASPLLSDFPSDSWFAFAGSDAGRSFAQGLAIGGPAIQQALGFDLGSEVGRWAGDVGGFVRGTSLFGLGGALVMETSDEQASTQTLDSLERALSSDPSVDVSPLSTSGEHGFSLSPSGVPVELQFVQRDGKVVVGLADSIADVFSPTSRLADSDAFKAATSALGEGFSPVTFIDFGPLFQLVDGFPQSASSPGYQRAKPYLDHLDYLIFGARSEGNRAAGRIALGLQDASSGAGSGGSASPAALEMP